MAEETVDKAVEVCGLTTTGPCVTKGLLLDGAHGWSPTMFIRLIQDFGLDSEVGARSICQDYYSILFYFFVGEGGRGPKLPVNIQTA